MNGYLQAAIGFMAASGFTAWTTIALCGAAKLAAHHRTARRPPAHRKPAPSTTDIQVQRNTEANHQLTEALERLGITVP